MVTLVLSVGRMDEVTGVVGIDLISCRLEGAGGGGTLVLVIEVEDGTDDCCCCCFPGVFNISIRLLSIKCSLKESVFDLISFEVVLVNDC